MSLPAIYFTTRRFYGKNEALISTLFLAITYGAISFTSVVFLNSIPLFSFIISSYLILSSIEEKTNPYKPLLAGIRIGLAIITKFTSIVFLITVILFYLLNRFNYKILLSFIIGVSIILILFTIIFYSEKMIGQLLYYHMTKKGYDLLSKTKIILVTFIIFYPLLIIYGLQGFIEVIFDKKRSKADLFYTLTMFIAIIFAFLMKYSHFHGPGIYLAPSVYAFCIISARMFKKVFPALIMILAFWVLFTSIIQDTSMLTCQRPENQKMYDSYKEGIDYLKKNSGKNDLLIISDYIPYYIPLLADRTIVPNLVDFSRYRFYYDLDYKKFIKEKNKAKYIIYNKKEQENILGMQELLSSIGLDLHPDTLEFIKFKNAVLVNNTKKVLENNDIIIYENVLYQKLV